MRICLLLLSLVLAFAAFGAAASQHPCEAQYDACIADCNSFGNPPVCSISGCKPCSAACMDYAVYCYTTCWTGANGDIYCLDHNNPN